MAAEPSVPVLAGLLHHGHARIPESWGLGGPLANGLWWRTDAGEAVATPTLVRLAASLPTEGEAIAALLATESRFRDAWLDLQSSRLRELGQRGAVDALCDAISALGAAASAVRARIASARLGDTSFGSVELPLFGAPADQPAAAPGLLRVLGRTAALVEGGTGRLAPALAPADGRDPSINWIAGRLIQTPGTTPGTAGTSVLSGAFGSCDTDRMTWALSTPWVTLLAVLAFTAEAWAAERHGGVALELPVQQVATFAAPSRINVVVTLADGREVLCGSLGELLLRTLDSLGMAVVPACSASELDVAQGPVIAELLRAGVWAWQPDARPRYVIGEGFGFDCYRGEGHRCVYQRADGLSQSLRSVCVAWARARTEQPGRAA